MLKLERVLAFNKQLNFRFTGDPKGIQRPTGGHLVSLSWVMKNLYNMKEGERW